MSEFDPNWQHGHVTRDGHRVTIVATDVAGLADGRSIVGVMNGYAWSWHANGRSSSAHSDTTDLINAPAPKKRVKVDEWINIYRAPEGAISGHASRKDADKGAADDRVGVVHLTGTIEEGETVEVKLPC